MAMSEGREVAVRKEMPVMYKESVTCEGMTVEGARMPSTAVPSTTATVPSAAKTATVTTTTAPVHSHSGRANAECRNGR